jgi:hypothetical protein
MVKRVSGFYGKGLAKRADYREAKKEVYLPLFKLVYHYGISRKVIADALGLYADQITPRMEGRYPLTELEKIAIDSLVLDAAAGRVKPRGKFTRRTRFRGRPDQDFWKQDSVHRGNLDVAVASELGFLIQHESLVILEGTVVPEDDRWWLHTLSGAWVRVLFLNGFSGRVLPGKKQVVAGNLASFGSGAMTAIASAVIVDAQASDMLLIRGFISRMMKPLVQFPGRMQNACKSLSMSQLRTRRKHIYLLSRLWLTRLGASIFNSTWLHFAGDQERRLDGRRVPLTARAYRYAWIKPANFETRPDRPNRNDDRPEPDQTDLGSASVRGRYVRRPEVPTRYIERDQAYSPSRRSGSGA